MKNLTYIVSSLITMSVAYMILNIYYEEEELTLNAMFFILFITAVCVAGIIIYYIKDDIREELKQGNAQNDTDTIIQLRNLQHVNGELRRAIRDKDNAIARLNRDLKTSVWENTYKIETSNSVLLQNYVLCSTQNGGTAYKLAADVFATTITGYIYHPSVSALSRQSFHIISYAVSKIYWNNSGYIEFDTPEAVYMDSSRAITDKDGVTYNVTLTDERVEATKQEINKLNALKKSIDKHKSIAINDVKKLMNEAEIDFPYYASILADYWYTLDKKDAWELENKDRPAIKTAERMKLIARELRNERKEKKLLELQQSVYEDAFPWLSEYKIISKEDIKQIAEADNPGSEKKALLRYLSPIEYESLSNVEKYQLALDKYKKKHKTNWQIGISFERYIGYLYEQKGYKVIYYGAIMGLQDLGRDIIAYNDSEVVVIQCKYWSNMKQVREKHIFQLYGTMMALRLEEHKEYKNKTVRGEFISSAPLSDEAKLYAEKMNIKYIENENFDKDYPCIKCNISNANQDKIYHLPFDQQYDKVQIDVSKGECYVSTVAEAEALGFRRAKKWVDEEHEG